MSDDIDNYMPYLEEAAKRAGTVLEIGVGKGTGSTLAFAHGVRLSDHSEPFMISVDHQDRMEWKPDWPWWHLIMGDSRHISTLDKVQLLYVAPVNLIFIDTHHTPEQITPELELWQAMADRHTTWLFHDTYMMGQYNPMVDAIKEFAAKNGWIYEDVFTDPHGLGRMYR